MRVFGVASPTPPARTAMGGNRAPGLGEGEEMGMKGGESGGDGWVLAGLGEKATRGVEEMGRKEGGGEG